MDTNIANNILTKEDVYTLPLAIQRFMIYTKAIGKERVKVADINQIGSFRVNNAWKTMKAKQNFDFVEGSFVWKAKIGIIRVVDQFVDGKGLLFAKLFNLFPLVKATGKEVDQGEVLRLLSEMIWFPSALISDYIQWTHVDETTSRATISYGDDTAFADFNVDDDGKLITIQAKRYMEDKGTNTLEDWEVRNFEYKELLGQYLPLKGEVLWKLKDGDYPYCRIEVTEMKVNS